VSAAVSDPMAVCSPHSDVTERSCTQVAMWIPFSLFVTRSTPTVTWSTHEETLHRSVYSLSGVYCHSIYLRPKRSAATSVVRIGSVHGRDVVKNLKSKPFYFLTI